MLFRSNKQSIQAILNISISTSLEKYLGCPIINGRVNKETFKDIIISTQNQLTKWKASAISQEGRATLIRANLAAKPNHVMQSFMLPSSIHQDLNKKNKNFFWNKGEHHSPLIGWDRICKPKNNGGINLRKAEGMNKAMQMKLLWKLLIDPSNI